MAPVPSPATALSRGPEPSGSVVSGRVAVRIATVIIAGMLPLTACGSSDGTPPEAADAAAATPSAVVEPIATAGALPAAVPAPTGTKAAKVSGPTAAATTPPTVPASSAAAPKAPAAGPEGEANPTWRADTVAALRKIDPRLVVDEAATVAVVTSTCKKISGMFSGKAVEVVRARFSTPAFQVTDAMAGQIYRVILAEACYTM